MTTEENAAINVQDSAQELPPKYIGSSSDTLSYPKLYKINLFSLSLLLPILTLCFGGIHPTVYLPAYFLVFTLTAINLVAAPDAAKILLSKNSPATRLVLLCFGAFLVFLAFQYAILSSRTTLHPILGENIPTFNSARFFSSLETFLFAVSAFILTRLFLTSSPKASTHLKNLIILTGIGTALVGLTHWFYDNGKLFWSFAPDSVFLSERARWPFVNANHLGDFLLIPVFLLLGELATQFTSLKNKLSNSQAYKLSRSRSTQSEVIKFFFTGLATIVVALCIIATLSRGAWLGFSVGLLLLAMGSYFLLPGQSAGESPPLRLMTDEPYESNRKRRRSRSSKGAPHKDGFPNINTLLIKLSSLVKPVLVISALALLLFFLNEQGTERVVGRIEYGLAHSLDNIRWIYYDDTLPMLLNSPLIGVGFGNWYDNFAPVLSPRVTGLLPEYLHSDPLQFVTEVGFLGSLPILFLIAGLIKLVIKAQRSSYITSVKAILILLTAIAPIAFLVATLPEFPLRMPAIVFSLMLIISLLGYSVDTSEPDHN